MEKRKLLSKGRLLKTKIDASKAQLDQISSDQLLKLSKVTENPKKSSTPSRLSKPKNILNKRTSETPKFKLEDLELKRKSIPSTEENLESYYNSYIKALIVKLDKHKTRNTEIEEEIKSIEMNFKLEENNLRKEIEKLNFELKKLRKEKTEQESNLMEENFRLRRTHESFKSSVSSVMNEIIALVTAASEKNNGNEEVFIEITKKIYDVSVIEQENSVTRLSLKDTASFSNAVAENYSPKGEVRTGFKEAIVLYSHTPFSCEEIELNVGDRVFVFNSDDLNGWWTGKVGDRVGKFPRSCVMLD